MYIWRGRGIKKKGGGKDGMMPPHQPPAARPRNAGQGVGGWEKGRIPTLNKKKIKKKKKNMRKKRLEKSLGSSEAEWETLSSGLGSCRILGAQEGGTQPGPSRSLVVLGMGVPHSAPPQLLGESQSLSRMFQTGFYWCKLGVWPAG